MGVLLLDQEALYFLPTLVAEDGHGELQAGEFLVRPSAYSVLGVGRQLEIA